MGVLLAVCLSGLTAAACAHGGKAGGGRDAIAISALTPSPETPLRRGQLVSVSVSATYSLNSAEAGEVALIVYAPKDGRDLIELQPTVTVRRGDGHLNLAAAFSVPNDDEIDEIAVAVMLAHAPTAMSTVRSKPAAQQKVRYQVR